MSDAEETGPSIADTQHRVAVEIDPFDVRRDARAGQRDAEAQATIANRQLDEVVDECAPRARVESLDNPRRRRPGRREDVSADGWPGVAAAECAGRDAGFGTGVWLSVG